MLCLGEMKNSQHEVNLERPGAGLPLWELLIARYWVLPRQSAAMNWDESNAAFLREGEKILKLTEGLSAQQLETRVLVPRLRGMEDSSRYWSAAMTLEHLMIVGELCAQAIESLAHGDEVQINKGIADLKPQGLASGAAVRENFRKFLDRVHAQISKPTLRRDSAKTAPHPWFGEMTAHRWNWLIASHQWLHRQQVKAIVARFTA
jgi:hypothetical protein